MHLNLCVSKWSEWSNHCAIFEVAKNMFEIVPTRNMPVVGGAIKTAHFLFVAWANSGRFYWAMTTLRSMCISRPFHDAIFWWPTEDHPSVPTLYTCLLSYFYVAFGAKRKETKCHMHFARFQNLTLHILIRFREFISYVFSVYAVRERDGVEFVTHRTANNRMLSDSIVFKYVQMFRRFIASSILCCRHCAHFRIFNLSTEAFSYIYSYEPTECKQICERVKCHRVDSIWNWNRTCISVRIHSERYFWMAMENVNSEILLFSRGNPIQHFAVHACSRRAHCSRRANWIESKTRCIWFTCMSHVHHRKLY